MRLSCEAIREFKEIYEQEFGERLSDVEAEPSALRLLRFCGLLTHHPQGGNSGPASAALPGGTHKSEEVR